MSACARIVSCVLGIIALVITVGVSCGLYLPNRFFNARVQEQVCDVFASVRPCFGNVPCYEVVRNTRPYWALCWQSVPLATFANQTEAKAYVAGWKGYSYRCLWDPDNPCQYYNEYADEVGTLTAVVICGIFTVAFSVLCIVLSCRKQYEAV
jgi:hypothetical protein